MTKVELAVSEVLLNGNTDWITDDLTPFELGEISFALKEAFLSEGVEDTRAIESIKPLMLKLPKMYAAFLWITIVDSSREDPSSPWKGFIGSYPEDEDFLRCLESIFVD